MDVIITQTSSNTMAITPGTKLGAPFKSGFYVAVGRLVEGPGWGVL